MESKHKRIFIVGHSGAGKGVLAKALADKLGWKHLDADFALSPSIGWPMNEVLGDEGEISFYECLGEVLTHQKNQDNIIVTTDDSLICSKKNREMLLSEFVVYLNVSVPVQLERITYNRPLLSSDGYDLLLKKLHIERDMHFEEVAKLTLNSDHNDLDGHVKAVMKALQQ